MRRLLAVSVVIVLLVAGASKSSALFSGRDVPFLDDSDRDTVCAAALHYQPPEERRRGDSGASHTATSTAIAAIRTNASNYRVGQPLLGLYETPGMFGVDSSTKGID